MVESALDVAIHLSSTNSFWEASIGSGVAGTPTEILASFDPVATPAQMVATSGQGVTDVVEAFAASTESLAALVAELAPCDWELPAEVPPVPRQRQRRRSPHAVGFVDPRARHPAPTRRGASRRTR